MESIARLKTALLFAISITYSCEKEEFAICIWSTSELANFNIYVGTFDQTNCKASALYHS